MASGVQGEPGGRSPDEEGSCERSLNEVCWENIVISRVFFCFYLSRRKVRHVCVRTVEVFMAGIRGAGNLRVKNCQIFSIGKIQRKLLYLTVASRSVPATPGGSLFAIA